LNIIRISSTYLKYLIYIGGPFLTGKATKVKYVLSYIFLPMYIFMVQSFTKHRDVTFTFAVSV
jgi:hypothetical protein